MKRWTAVLAAILFLTFFGGSARADSAERYQQAVGLLAENRYNEAEELFASLGNYRDSRRYAVYCGALEAGEAGDREEAILNLRALGGFLDSELLATYYTGLAWEAQEEYELARAELEGISLYRDAADRLARYPALIRTRDYGRAEAAEQRGDLQTALEGFRALGRYSDSSLRAAEIQKKLNAEAYAAAAEAEENGDLETALAGFEALEHYSDSILRVRALQEKLPARDYAAAEQAEAEEDWIAAFDGFTALGDYLDSAERAAALKEKSEYARAMNLIQAGEYTEACEAFRQLGDFEDSAEKARVLGICAFASETEAVGDGIISYTYQGRCGLILPEQNLLTEPVWDTVEAYNSLGLARVSLDGKYGYIDGTGAYVIPCEWDALSDFGGNTCTAALRGEEGISFGLLDSTGTQIAEPCWRELGQSYVYQLASDPAALMASVSAPVFTDGMIRAESTEGKWGFLGEDGQQIGEAAWDYIDDFSEGYAAVKSGDLYGYISSSAELVIPPQFEVARPFREGKAAVCENGTWRYIGTDGETVIPALYEDAESFSGGYANVLFPGEGWQVIDASGRVQYFIDEEMIATYREARENEENGAYDEALAGYRKIQGYEDSTERIQTVLDLKFAAAVTLKEEGKYEDAIGAFEALEGCRDVAEQIEACETGILEREYNTASSLKESGKYEAAIAAFQALEGYRDSAEQIEACETGILDRAYAAAMALKDAGKYKEAITAFQALEGYRDSAEQIEACETEIKELKYEAAVTLKNEGKYEEAIAAFEALDGYRDSGEQIRLCGLEIRDLAYAAAVALQEAGKYEEAIAAFEALDGYQDLAERIEACRNALKEKACQEAAEKQTEEAAKQTEDESYGAGGSAGSDGEEAPISGSDQESQEEDRISGSDRESQEEGPISETTETAEETAEVNSQETAEEAAEETAQETAEVTAEETLQETAEETGLPARETVFFGSWPQTAQGDDRTPIEWLVLERNETEVLLLSVYGLDVRPYHKESANVTWRWSSIRDWLNSDFLNRAFTGEEKASIRKGTVDNSKAQNNSAYKTKSGYDTEDRVFLLSYQEAFSRYLTDSEDRMTTATAYAAAKGAAAGTQGTCCWWLRSPGSSQKRAIAVNAAGECCDEGLSVRTVCVRPAIRVSPDALSGQE